MALQARAHEGRRLRPRAEGPPRAAARCGFSSTWITARPGASDEFVEFVAYHLEQSCKLGREVGRGGEPPPVERAVDALMRAAEKAERREGIREADRYYARALELVGDAQSEQTLELRLGRGGTLYMLERLEAAPTRSPRTRSPRAPPEPAVQTSGRGRSSTARTSHRSRAEAPRRSATSPRPRRSPEALETGRSRSGPCDRGDVMCAGGSRTRRRCNDRRGSAPPRDHGGARRPRPADRGL